jgi:hypothetical protein
VTAAAPFTATGLGVGLLTTSDVVTQFNGFTMQ